MFGMFKAVTFDHPQLGHFKRSGGVWHGKLAIEASKTVALEMEGPKSGPHQDCVDVALQLPDRLPSLTPDIAKALLEHLEPYQEALSDPDEGYRDEFDETEVERILAIKTSEAAWNATVIEGVEIGLERSKTLVLIRLNTLWDIEHRLGAQFDDWGFSGLNGSV